MILGIDEAGRGPVLGPMVVAGVLLGSQASAALTKRGVVDSKKFGSGEKARRRREELERHVRRLAEDVQVEVLGHEEVDYYCARGLLNELERVAAKRIIGRSKPARKIIADGAKVFGRLRENYSHFSAFDFGEQEHVSVAAASIVAKVTRDKLFARIVARYDLEFGPVRGGGYANSATEVFFRRYHERYQRFPEETRRTWTWSVLKELESPML